MRKLAFLALSLALLVPVARADTTPPPSGVLSLNASASTEVDNDMLSIVMRATRDGAEAASVQSGLKQALDAALTEARKAARPGQVDVRAGNFSIFPRHSKNGQITGWQGTAEMTIEGKDMPAIAQLSGRITSMTVARLGYGLSRESREKAERAVVADAVAQFRSTAGDYAKLFGYDGYTIREVNVQGSEPPRYARMEMRASAASADQAPMPVEPGRATVSVSVNGTVQMK